MTRSRTIDGGFARMPNRWIDAGYMAAAPGSVTQVYLFLCRWANNQTGIAEQSIAQMARMLRMNQDRVRQATKVLRAWRVIERLPTPMHNAIPRWRLVSLPKRAPNYPTKEQIWRLGDPAVVEGATTCKGDGLPRQERRGALIETTPSATTPVEAVPTGTGGTYQTNNYQTTLNQTAPTISSSGAKAPTDDVSDADVRQVPSSMMRATDGEDGAARDHGNAGPDANAALAGKEEQARRRDLVRELRDRLNGHGYNYVLSDEQAREIYAGRNLAWVLDDDQLDFLKESLSPSEWDDLYPPF